MRTLLLGRALVAGAACRPAAGGGTPAPSGDTTEVTVHQVLVSPSLTGTMVLVHGTCLGYAAPFVAHGPPPLTRSDWQLGDGGEALWVSGPLPAGCTSTTPATAPTAVVARVAQDTVQALGGGTAVRRYLVVGR